MCCRYHDEVYWIMFEYNCVIGVIILKSCDQNNIFYNIFWDEYEKLTISYIIVLVFYWTKMQSLKQFLPSPIISTDGYCCLSMHPPVCPSICPPVHADVPPEECYCSNSLRFQQLDLSTMPNSYSTTRFASDVGYRMVKHIIGLFKEMILLTITSNSLTLND